MDVGDPTPTPSGISDGEGGVDSVTASVLSVLDRARLQQWIVCFVVVTFDLELGQAIEYVFPGVELSPKERTNICFNAFPDSNSETGDTQFCFRLRDYSGRASREPEPMSPRMRGTPPRKVSAAQQQRAGPSGAIIAKAGTGRKRDTLADQYDYYYGHVYFRQAKDPSIRRGYFQKSLIILTRNAFIPFYSSLMRQIGPAFFDGGGRHLLECMCTSIAKWDPPTPGSQFEVPMLGSVLRVQVPKDAGPESYASRSESTLRNGVVASINGTLIGDYFVKISSSLRAIWELVLTAEPIAVMAPSPAISSNAVIAIVSLIAPVPFCCDFRPFFTIHDTEFKEYTTKTMANPPNVVLGVTNPFFIKALDHWPHLLKVGTMSKASKASGSLEWKQGFYSKYSALLKRDSEFVKRIQSMHEKGMTMEQITESIRGYFGDLAQAFLIPLDQYFTTLMPLYKKIVPWRDPPRVKHFDNAAFLVYVKDRRPAKLEGNYVSLYKAFLKSLNFKGWLRQRKREANMKLRALYLTKLCEADMHTWLGGKHEVERVDMLLRLRNEQKSATSKKLMTPTLKSRLAEHVNVVVASLPADLRMSLDTASAQNSVVL